MIHELLTAFSLIFVAEMGDKTQILAMAFATKYKVKQVLMGIFIGSFLNHAIAVILGKGLSSLMQNVGIIKLIAAIAFIIFGLLSFKADDDEDDEKESKIKFGPVFTVAMAFFVGELGDKTQLTAFTYASTATNPAIVLAGTVLGMIATGAIGIFLGMKLGKKIPELAIKMIAGTIFIFFGVIGLFEHTPQEYITTPNIIIFFAILAATIYLFLSPTLKAAKDKKLTAYRKAAEDLYSHTQHMKESVQKMCLGKENCKSCMGKGCVIGFLKEALKDINLDPEFIISTSIGKIPSKTDKSFDVDAAAEGLGISLAICTKFDTHSKDFIFSKTRQAFETICFGKTFSFNGDLDEYFAKLSKENSNLTTKIKKSLKTAKV